MRILAWAVTLIAVPVQAQYAGSKSCARCHRTQFEAFSRSPMGRSLAAVSSMASPEFQKPAQFLHSKTGRRYRIFQRDSERLIEESFVDENGRLIYSDSRTVHYAIGSGNHATSFLLERSGRIYEAPVTYFTHAGRWDMSPGYDTQQYVGFTRRVTANCLFCHAGRLNSMNKAGDIFQTPEPFAEKPIGCERCHGAGQQHVGQPDTAIINPSKLPPELRDQVCEQCHLFGAARVTQPGKSMTDYRPGGRLDAVLAVYAWEGTAAAEPSVTGHPLEMKQSVCWQKSRNTMWCGSCHEVHARKPTASKPAFYRAKCVNCHQRSCNRRPEPSGAVHRENNCIACHMPKRPVIESAHVTFTDHRIMRRPSANISPPGSEKLKSILPAELDDPVVASRNLGFAYAELAGSTGRLEFHRRAVTILQPLIGTSVADASFWQTLAEAHLADGELQQAEEAFRKATALDLSLAGAHYGLGYLLQRRGLLPEAIQAYRRAANIDPYKAEVFGNLAAAYFSMRQKDEALAALRAALALEPGNVKWREVELAVGKSKSQR